MRKFTSDFELKAIEKILATFPEPSVLQLGSRRMVSDGPVKDALPSCRRFVGLDIQGGQDVDLIGDAHNLVEVLGGEKFEVMWSDAFLEHVEDPFRVASQVSESLVPGGLTVHVTHQTFPIHGYPSDYFRFTREALEVLFGKRHGFEVLSSQYAMPCSISGIPAGLKSYIHVKILSRKLD